MESKTIIFHNDNTFHKFCRWGRRQHGARGGTSLSKNALKLVYWFKEFATLTPLIKNKKKVATLPP